MDIAKEKFGSATAFTEKISQDFHLTTVKEEMNAK